jgi:alkaline phosphatase D
VSHRDHPTPRGAPLSARRLNRRKFLGGAAAGLGTYALFGGPAILTSRGAVATGGTFPQSVASGQPTNNGITLWTKVNDLSGGSSVRLEIYTDSGGDSGVFRGEVEALPSNPTIFKTRVDDEKVLKPGEQYYYRFLTQGSEPSPQGRFRTARADSNAPVKIAFFSCQEFGSGFFHAHTDLAAMDDIDLVVCLGDYIYEKKFDTTPARLDESGVAQTLDEYRSKYDYYQEEDTRLLRMRENHALMAVWDDHEVEDNYAEMLPGGQTDDGRRVPYRRRMANGYQAFFEYMPRFPSGAPTQIYGSMRLGNAEVFLLDQRQYRDNQVCAPGDDFFAPGCPPNEHSKPGRTLLGKDQLGWLKDGLSKSTATWKIVANEVMIMSLDEAPGNPLNTDSWDGYGDERRELIDHIAGKNSDGKNILNVTFVTGDIHTFFAGDVTRSGRVVSTARTADAGGPIAAGPPRATEFVGGSVSSKGIADRAGQDDRSKRAAAAVGDTNVFLNNPHIKFSNQAFKGYTIIETGRGVDRDLRVTYRAVCGIKSEKNETVNTLAEFRVEADQDEPTVQSSDPRLGRLDVCSPLQARE